MQHLGTAPRERSYLVIGSDGALGAAVTAELRDQRHLVTGMDRSMIDLRERDVVQQQVVALWETAGPFDGLVYAAGLFPAVAATETSEDLFDELMTVNARSALIAAATLTRLCVAEQRPASVVVVSSGAAARPQPGTIAYAASKAALEAIVRGLALEAGPHGIRVNAVAPGFIDVGSTINPIPRDYVDVLAATSPQRRVATTDDIVPSIIWLLSDASQWVNGQSVTVDGGASLGSMQKPSWLTRTK